MRVKNQPLVSVIVPTKNSAVLLQDFLDSFKNSTYKYFEIIINDDITSTDNTKQIVNTYNKYFKTYYLQKNVAMAQGRVSASKHAKGDVFMHLDSDMQVTPGLLQECVKLIQNRYDALVIPEVSVGYSFWAKVKALEKSMYQGVEQLESARVFTKEAYSLLGGHNIEMVFSEDKDLDIRARDAGMFIGKTKNTIIHNEGSIKLIQTLRKKLNYSNTANKFAEVHPAHYRWQANPLNRYYIFIRNVKYIFISPLEYSSVYVLKSLEYIYAFIGTARTRLEL